MGALKTALLWVLGALSSALGWLQRRADEDQAELDAFKARRAEIQAESEAAAEARNEAEAAADEALAVEVEAAVAAVEADEDPAWARGELIPAPSSAVLEERIERAAPEPVSLAGLHTGRRRGDP